MQLSCKALPLLIQIECKAKRNNICLDISKIYQRETSKPIVFVVPDIFLGAMYNQNTSTWLWSDGSNASFPPPVPERSGKCSQKLLEPFEDIMVDRDCSGFKAHYACQFKRKRMCLNF